MTTTAQPSLFPRGSATWGPPGDASSLWRLTLRRPFGVGPRVAFVMLNPSKATEDVNDPTVRRCVGYAQRWGFGELVVVNLFAFRATDPADLLKAVRVHGLDFAIGLGNDDAIQLAAAGSKRVVAAWGTLGCVGGRGRAVARLLRRSGRELECLKTTKQGDPAHPLYLRADLTPKPWSPSND